MRHPVVHELVLALVVLSATAGCGDDNAGSSANESASTATHAPRLDGETVIDFHGIGPVRAGMTVGDAEQAAGRRLVIVEFEQFGGHCYFAYPAGMKDDVILTVLSPNEKPVENQRDGIIGRASSEESVTPSPARTKTGIGIGSTVQEVRAAYSDFEIEESKHHYIDGLYIDVTAPRGRTMLRFEVGPEGVFALHGGNSEAVTLVEGCA